MGLHLHRAERTDLLADGLGALLATPLPDPFAEELVIVPAKGVERWLSQRLCHILGRGDGARTASAPASRSAIRSSLIAEITGTTDDDPWSPDAMVWPLLEVIDASCKEGWCKTLATHLGHFETGEERELRQGRRYAVARRLAGLFASYARQRPQLLVDWESDITGDIAPTFNGSRLSGARWSTESTPTHPTSGTPKPLARLQESTTDLPERLSLFGHTRLPSTEVELLNALATHHDLHLWLPHPSDDLWQKLAGEHGPVPRRDDTSHRNVGHPLLATLGRDLRELQRSLPADRRPTNTSAATTAPTRCSAGCSPTSPPTRSGRKAGRTSPTTARCRCTAATAPPGRSTSSAKCCSACSPTTRRSNPATSSSCARTSRPTRR